MAAWKASGGGARQDVGKVEKTAKNSTSGEFGPLPASASPPRQAPPTGPPARRSQGEELKPTLFRTEEVLLTQFLHNQVVVNIL